MVMAPLAPVPLDQTSIVPPLLNRSPVAAWLIVSPASMLKLPAPLVTLLFSAMAPVVACISTLPAAVTMPPASRLLKLPDEVTITS